MPSDRREGSPRSTARPLARRLAPWGLAMGTLAAGAPAVALSFPSGVAAGDAFRFGALLWTRTDAAADLTVEVALDPGFGQIVFTGTARASAASDFTARLLVASLAPARTYWYRFRSGAVASPTGSFATPAVPGAAVPVRFAFAGASDGTRVAGVPYYGEFTVFAAIEAAAPEFLVYAGDTAFADSAARLLDGRPPASTLEEFRDLYRVNRADVALASLLAATSVYPVWGDREIRDGLTAGEVDPGLLSGGRQAFLEYLPLRLAPLPPDPGCAVPSQVRAFRWGSDTLVFLLDVRSCASPSAAAVCQGDLAPALPAAERVALGLPPDPPAGCREALADPARTLLGARQKAILEGVLDFTDARFKLIAAPAPMRQLYFRPYERWEGYEAERREVLQFIRDRGIGGVVFLSTGLGATLAGNVVLDPLAEPEPIAVELAAGPVADATLAAQVEAELGQEGLALLADLLDLAGPDCRSLDVFSWGLVEVDPAAATATVNATDS